MPDSRAMVPRKTVIIGGGIAGLSVLWHLACRLGGGGRADDLLLLEREPLCGHAASGRNAGIFRQVESEEMSALLAVQTKRLLSILSDERLVDPVGAVYLSRDTDCVERLQALAAAAGVEVSVSSPLELPEARSLLKGGQAGVAARVVDDGVLDVHKMLETMRRKAVAEGARIRTRASVERLIVRSGRVEGVVLEGGEFIACERVVIAAGAWSGSIGDTAGAALPFQTLRRHLVFLDPDEELKTGPVLWRLDEQVYARPESGGALVSPCDETPCAPQLAPRVDRRVLFELGVRLSRSIPGLAQSAVRNLWACLRTFSSDRCPVAGSDPRVEGLYWLAGFGGQGLSTALSSGEVVASVIRGRDHPFVSKLSPARLDQ